MFSWYIEGDIAGGGQLSSYLISFPEYYLL